jgi:flagellar hook-length control protein FliK
MDTRATSSNDLFLPTTASTVGKGKNRRSESLASAENSSEPTNGAANDAINLGTKASGKKAAGHDTTDNASEKASGSAKLAKKAVDKGDSVDELVAEMLVEGTSDASFGEVLAKLLVDKPVAAKEETPSATENTQGADHAAEPNQISGKVLSNQTAHSKPTPSLPAESARSALRPDNVDDAPGTAPVELDADSANPKAGAAAAINVGEPALPSQQASTQSEQAAPTEPVITPQEAVEATPQAGNPTGDNVASGQQPAMNPQAVSQTVSQAVAEASTEPNIVAQTAQTVVPDADAATAQQSDRDNRPQADRPRPLADLLASAPAPAQADPRPAPRVTGSTGEAHDAANNDGTVFRFTTSVSTGQDADLVGATATTVVFNAGSVEATTGSSAAAAPLEQLPLEEALPIVRVINQVTQALASMRVSQRTVIQLDPPELGRIRMSIESRGNELHAVLQVENSRTFNDLQREAPALMERMAEAGVTMRQVEVHLSNDTTNGSSQGQSGQSFASAFEDTDDRGQGADNDSSDDNPNNPAADQADGDAATLAASESVSYVSDDAINVWI